MKEIRIIIIALVLFTSIFPLIAQQRFKSLRNQDFDEAAIRSGNQNLSIYEIRSKENATVSKSNFFEQYKSYFQLNDDYQFVQVREFTDLLN